MAVLSSSNQTSDRKLKNEMSNVDLPPSVEASASASPNSSMSSSSTPPSSVDWQSRRGHASSKEPRVHDLEAEEEEEVIEVIDLTRPERVGSYPQPDFLSRVPGFDRQMSFELPTLQRLVSRSSESVERSQNRPRRPIEVHEIPDDDDDNDDDDNWDRYGRNTVRIDSEVREVQLDPRHPWAQGPIELIARPMYRSTVRTLKGKDQRKLEDVVVVGERPPPVNGGQIESDDEEDHGARDNGATKGKESTEHEWARELQRASEEAFRSSLLRRRSPTRARSRSREPRSRSHSFMASASPSPFPITPSHPADRSSRIKRRGEHRFSPVARPPSPVPLILRPETLPSPPAPSSTQAVQVIAKGPPDSPQDARSALLLSSQESNIEREIESETTEERHAPDPSDDDRVLRLRRASEQPARTFLPKRSSSPRRARSHTPEFRSQSYSFLALPIVFPIPSNTTITSSNTTSSSSNTTTTLTTAATTTTAATLSARSTNRIQRSREHRFTPIARVQSPAPLIKVKIRASPS